MKKNMNQVRQILIIAGLILLSASVSYGQQLKAHAQPNPVTQGERIQVTYSLDASGSNFQGPSFSDFEVMMGPSQSQSIQIINGNMSRSLKYSYVLKATKVGKHTISPASIVVDGKRIRSESLTIVVLEPSKSEKKRRQRAKEQKEKEERSLSQQANEIMSQNLYLTITLNKNKIYEGEQVIATYKLHAHPDLTIVQMSAKKSPVFDGFWIQEYDLGNLKFARENVDGKLFNTAILKKVVLIPQRNGKLTIDPLELDFTIRLRVSGGRSRRNDPFANFFNDPFFGGSYRDFPFVLKSPVKTLNVKPLPDGAPDSFNGAVGSMLMESWIDTDEVPAGEPVTVKIKITGDGNIRLLDAPEVNFPPDFEVYDPKTTDNLSLNYKGMSGNKIFEILAIPRHTGEYSIDPIKFTYFDVDKENYITLRSDRFNVNVTKGKSGNYTSSVAKEEIKLLGKDINYIKLTPGNIHQIGTEINILAIIAGIAPALLLAFVTIYKKRSEKYKGNYDLLRNRKATKLARKRLAKAKSLIGQNEEEFYDETTRALWGYLSDKLLIPGSELNKENIADILKHNDIDQDIIDKLIDTIEKCEFARYAPQAAREDSSAVYSDSVEIITKLEEKLK